MTLLRNYRGTGLLQRRQCPRVIVHLHRLQYGQVPSCMPMAKSAVPHYLRVHCPFTLHH